MRSLIANKEFIMKKVYNPPSLTILYLKMEQTIAAGSAIVVAPDEQNQIFEEWQIGADLEKSIEWQPRVIFIINYK